MARPPTSGAGGAGAAIRPRERGGESDLGLQGSRAEAGFLAGETAGEPSDEIRRPGSAEWLMGLFRSKRPSWAARARIGPRWAERNETSQAGFSFRSFSLNNVLMN